MVWYSNWWFEGGGDGVFVLDNVGIWTIGRDREDLIHLWKKNLTRYILIIGKIIQITWSKKDDYEAVCKYEWSRALAQADKKQNKFQSKY